MNPRLAEAANLTLRTLASLVEGNPTPREAHLALSTCRERNPGVDIQLLWEFDAVPRAYHFDAVVSLRGAGSAIVSFCPERGLPFIARACHVRDDEIVRVNGVPVSATTALLELELTHDAAVARKLVDTILVRQAIEAQGADRFEPTVEDLQAAMNGFRKRHGLYRAADAREWLGARGLSQRALEERLASEVRVAKLRELVVGSRVDETFNIDRSRFDVMCVHELSMRAAELARDLVRDVASGEAGFLDIAHVALARGTATDLRVRRARRCEVDAGLAATVAPTVRELDGLAIVGFAEHVQAAELDAETRATICDWLFRGWLDERRAASHIEWFWGEVR